MIVSGHERVTLTARPDWRWWVWIDEPLARYFPKRHGRISATPGRFLFARGGRTTIESDCLHEIDRAMEEARWELAKFVHRPTHALGPSGELIPLGGEVSELDGPLLALGSGE